MEFMYTDVPLVGGFLQAIIPMIAKSGIAKKIAGKALAGSVGKGFNVTDIVKGIGQANKANKAGSIIGKLGNIAEGIGNVGMEKYGGGGNSGSQDGPMFGGEGSNNLIQALIAKRKGKEQQKELDPNEVVKKNKETKKPQTYDI